jgi:hypothetical protein
VQAEVLLAASVAVAQTFVVVLSPTDTVILKLPEVAAPVPNTLLVQVELVYRRTVEFASAVPENAGELLLAGPAGVTAVQPGAAGGVLSCT